MRTFIPVAAASSLIGVLLTRTLIVGGVCGMVLGVMLQPFLKAKKEEK